MVLPTNHIMFRVFFTIPDVLPNCVIHRLNNDILGPGDLFEPFFYRMFLSRYFPASFQHLRVRIAFPNIIKWH